MQEDQFPPRQEKGTDRGRHIVRGLGSLTIQSALGAFLGFVFLATLVRFLPQSDYGAYSSVQVSVGIAGVVCIFGLSSAVVYFLASGQGEAYGGWGAAKAALNLTVVLSALTSLVMVAAAPLLSAYFGKGASLVWIFYLGAVWLFVSSVSTIFQTMLQGMRKYGYLAKVLLGSRVVAVGLGVVAVAVYHRLDIVIITWVIYFGLALSATFPLVWGPLRRADPRPYYTGVMKYAYLLGLAGIVGSVAANADIVIVGGYLDLRSLGVYNAAVQISSVLSAFFVTPLITALFAEASLSSQSDEELRIGTSLAMRFSLVTLLPASLFAAALSPQLFDLFSGNRFSYASGIPYLQLITVFYVFSAVQTIALSILQGVGRTGRVLIVGGLTALGEVVLSASFVPSLGLAGAAYSRVAMFLVGSGLSLYFIREYIRRPIDYLFLAKAIVASVAPAVAIYLPSYFFSNALITVVPYTLMWVALFVVCARGLNLLSVDDKAYLSHLLPAGLHWILKFI